MDREMLDRLIAMMASENDTDAVMGLRGLQGLLRTEGVDFAKLIAAAVAQAGAMKTAAPAPAAPVIEQTPVAAAKAPPSVPVATGGLPQCVASGSDLTLATPAGVQEVINLPALAAQSAGMIAESLTDAIVAAVINKSRMKLKLVDVKDPKGLVVETMLRAEYDREGMMPIQVWVNARGEVAALAAVLRKGLANAMPDIMAA